MTNDNHPSGAPWSPVYTTPTWNIALCPVIPACAFKDFSSFVKKIANSSDKI